jgi:hypothetical protein
MKNLSDAGLELLKRQKEKIRHLSGDKQNRRRIDGRPYPKIKTKKKNKVCLTKM